MTEETLFRAALAKSATERAAFLEVACAGQPELRAAVEALLLAHDTSGKVLERSATPPTDVTGEYTPGPDEGAPPQTLENRPIETAGVVIAGRYTLVEVIGEGGMGSVYLASQSEPVKRQVALKLIKSGMDSKAVLARFEAERQALAMMDHPNIARVYDGGTTPSGQPFFVMELVLGVPLTKFCDQHRLSVDARLQLFVLVCQAVQHAHQKGIIHRDLKPGNVLVTEVDGRPTPKVIDFGVAKATEFNLTDQSFGDLGAIVGTPTYMSPEQADPTSMDIDTRTDVYALGVMLYELLVGSPPIDAKRFKRGAILEMLRMVREEEPPRPSTKLSTADALPNIAANRAIEPSKLAKLLRGELDWVVMKALEKDRTRRYDTANGLARDIQRFLADEVVEARPPSTGYRLKKFVRRHKGQVIAASFVLLALLGGIAGTTFGLIRAAKANTDLVAKNFELADEQAKVLAREAQAIDAVKKFRDAVANEPELKNNPALNDLRKRLLKEPLAFFGALREWLQADQDTRPESLTRLADACTDLGSLTSDIGDKQDALIALREALEIYQRLADANPTVPRYQSGVASRQISVGMVLDVVGRPAEARQAYDKAVAILEPLTKADPTDTRYQTTLAEGYNQIGVLLKKSGKPADALQSFASALAIYQRLADENPTNTGIQNSRAGCHMNIGVLQMVTGKSAEAMTSFGQALAIQQKLVDANPTVPEFQNRLPYIQTNIGDLQLSTGKPAEALKSFRRALEFQKKLANANPAVTEYQSVLASIHHKIGNLQYGIGERAEALESFGQTLTIRQKLADDNPSVIEFQNGLANTHVYIGFLQKDNGKPGEALKSHRQALAIQQKLADANPTVPDYRSRLAGTMHNIAEILFSQGDKAEALALYEQARSNSEAAVRADGTVAQYWIFLANHHKSIANVYRDAGKLNETLASVEQACLISERLARAHPESHSFASGLGVNLQAMAQVELEAMRFEGASVRLRQAVEWQRKALAANPNQPSYRQLLASHLLLLIRAAQKLGRSDEAAEAQRELNELKASDPRFVALDARLAAVLKGEAPKTNAERIALASRANDKSLYAVAARLWAEAMAADPKLADDRRAGHRYNAACAAAQAGSGKGKDNPAPDDAAKAHLRRQALDWLKVELLVWERVAQSVETGNKETVAKALANWIEDTDLASIRDEQELAKLPPDEREMFARLWADLAKVLKKIKEK